MEYLKMLEAIEWVMVARLYLEEVDYVHEAYKKFYKLNPMIAYSNTMMSDKENIKKFHGYAQKGLLLFEDIPQDMLLKDIKLRKLCGILLNEYQMEEQAIENRLNIYDCRLLPEAKQNRKEKEQIIKKCVMESGQKCWPELSLLIRSKAQIKWNLMRLSNIIESNQKVIDKYNKSIIFKSIADKKISKSQKCMEEYQMELGRLKEKQHLLQNQIQQQMDAA